MAYDEQKRVMELLAESLIRQDQLMELMQQLRGQQLIVNDKLDTADSTYADILRRLANIERRQDQQQQLMAQLLEILAGKWPGDSAQRDNLLKATRHLLPGQAEDTPQG